MRALKKAEMRERIINMSYRSGDESGAFRQKQILKELLKKHRDGLDAILKYNDENKYAALVKHHRDAIEYYNDLINPY